MPRLARVETSRFLCQWARPALRAFVPTLGFEAGAARRAGACYRARPWSRPAFPRGVQAKPLGDALIADRGARARDRHRFAPSQQTIRLNSGLEFGPWPARS